MNGALDRLASALMRHAQRLTPAARRSWARAMAAELPHTPPGTASLQFALGCFWAALRLRAEGDGRRQIIRDAALAAAIGALFCAHASVPGSRAWPLIWPAAGGAMSVLMSLRASKPLSAFTSAGAKAGAVASMIFFLGGIFFLWWIEAPDLRGRVDVLGIAAALGILISASTATLVGACIRTR